MLECKVFLFWALRINTACGGDRAGHSNWDLSDLLGFMGVRGSEVKHICVEDVSMYTAFTFKNPPLLELKGPNFIDGQRNMQSLPRMT